MDLSEQAGETCCGHAKQELILHLLVGSGGVVDVSEQAGGELLEDLQERTPRSFGKTCGSSCLGCRGGVGSCGSSCVGKALEVVARPRHWKLWKFVFDFMVRFVLRFPDLLNVRLGDDQSRLEVTS